MDNYGYMVVCFNNEGKVVGQTVFTQHSIYEVQEIVDKAFTPNYYRVGIYTVRETGLYES